MNKIIENADQKVAIERMVLAGDLDRAQALNFVEDAIQKAPNELFAIRMRWLRDYLLQNAKFIPETATKEDLDKWAADRPPSGVKS